MLGGTPDLKERLQVGVGYHSQAVSPPPRRNEEGDTSTSIGAEEQTVSSGEETPKRKVSNLGIPIPIPSSVATYQDNSVSTQAAETEERPIRSAASPADAAPPKEKRRVNNLGVPIPIPSSIATYDGKLIVISTEEDIEKSAEPTPSPATGVVEEEDLDSNSIGSEEQNASSGEKTPERKVNNLGIPIPIPSSVATYQENSVSSPAAETGEMPIRNAASPADAAPKEKRRVNNLGVPIPIPSSIATYDGKLIAISTEEDIEKSTEPTPGSVTGVVGEEDLDANSIGSEEQNLSSEEKTPKRKVNNLGIPIPIPSSSATYQENSISTATAETGEMPIRNAASPADAAPKEKRRVNNLGVPIPIPSSIATYDGKLIVISTEEDIEKSAEPPTPGSVTGVVGEEDLDSNSIGSEEQNASSGEKTPERKVNHLGIPIPIPSSVATYEENSVSTPAAETGEKRPIPSAASPSATDVPPKEKRRVNNLGVAIPIPSSIATYDGKTTTISKDEDLEKSAEQPTPGPVPGTVRKGDLASNSQEPNEKTNEVPTSQDNGESANSEPNQVLTAEVEHQAEVHASKPQEPSELDASISQDEEDKSSSSEPLSGPATGVVQEEKYASKTLEPDSILSTTEDHQHRRSKTAETPNPQDTSNPWRRRGERSNSSWGKQSNWWDRASLGGGRFGQN
eukprot:scaffold6966_cov112-Cylindrotheca_fusiformis.AAC.24